MANPSIKRLVGPIALTTTLTTNVYQGTTGTTPAGAAASALIYDIVKHIHIANKTGSAATFTLYLGLTGANTAGTELFTAVSVPANSVFDWYGNLKMLSTDFLVGGAGTTTALTITIEGEQYVV